jgi:hypothetical protein
MCSIKAACTWKLHSLTHHGGKVLRGNALQDTSAARDFGMFLVQTRRTQVVFPKVLLQRLIGQLLQCSIIVPVN